MCNFYKRKIGEFNLKQQEIVIQDSRLHGNDRERTNRATQGGGIIPPPLHPTQ